MKHTVKYPSTINRIFRTLDETCEELEDGGESLKRLLKTARLPDNTLFHSGSITTDEDETVGRHFDILLPTGEIFGGVAILKPGDICDCAKANLMAAGRAVAVLKNYFYFCGEHWGASILKKHEGFEEKKNKVFKNIADNMILRSAVKP